MGKCRYDRCNREDWNNSGYCIFHAPMEIKSNYPIAQFNREFIDLLDRQKANFIGFVFPGPIAIGNRVLQRGLTFSEAIFHGTLTLKGIEIPGDVSFYATDFRDGLVLSDVVFNSGVTFHDAVFSFMRDEKRSLINALDCNRVTFNAGVDFSGSSFEKGFVNVSNTTFKGPKANFENSQFYIEDGMISFSDCQFKAWSTSFRNATLFAKRILFSQTEFNGGELSFELCKFNGRHFNLSKVDFCGTRTTFLGAEFNSDASSVEDCTIGENGITFSETSFNGGFVIFRNIELIGDFEFRLVGIGAIINFSNFQIGDKSNVYLVNPNFLSRPNIPGIVFREIRFIPFRTFFQGFAAGEGFADVSYLEKPLVLFRYCYLKDAYFADCKMGLFSFYTSTFFEEAHFTSGTWLCDRERIFRWLPFAKYKREYKLLDEILMQIPAEEAEEDRSRSRIAWLSMQEPPGQFAAVIDLYDQMKTATDRTKSYQKASWFYFNEIEMKRHLLISEIKNSGGWLKKILKSVFCLRLHLYNSYKLFAGYGEKPFWSLTWFMIAVIGFGVFHLFNGFKTPIRTINYDFAPHFPNIGRFVEDLGFALLFALYRLVPVYLLPFDRTSFSLQDFTFWDICLSFLNTFVLILLLVFVGVGLKRHFRRF